jgi:hypothetical protein
MYQSHSSFQNPPNIDIPLWRYMSFTRYLSLLRDRALHFSRYDSFEDRFEGSYAQINFDQLIQRIAPQLQEPMGYGQDMLEQEDYVRAITQDPGHQRMPLHRRQRNRVGVNCWHMGPDESVAMWRTYVGSGEGVALRSTFRRLQRAFHGGDQPTVHIRMVHYTDHSKAVPDQTPFDALLHKRNWYRYEQEVRAMCHYGGPDEDESAAAPKVFPVPVDIEELVEHVVVMPKAADWFICLAQEATDRFGFPNLPIQRSDMDQPPLR